MIRAAVIFLCLGLAACAAGAPADDAATSEADILAPAPSLDRPSGPGPDQLLHLADADVRQMLGEPEFVWVEAGAAMWRYRGQGCFVDVFLYPNEGVTFVDVHGDDLDDLDRAACFRQLLEQGTG